MSAAAFAPEAAKVARQTEVPWGTITLIGALGAAGAAVWYFIIPDAKEIADAGRELSAGATDVGDDIVDFVVDSGEKGVGLAEDVVVDLIGKKIIGGTAKGIGEWWDNTFGRNGRIDNLIHWPWEKDD